MEIKRQAHNIKRTFIVTYLIIRSVFAAYFNCEVLHVGLVRKQPWISKSYATFLTEQKEEHMFTRYYVYTRPVATRIFKTQKIMSIVAASLIPTFLLIHL